MIRLRRRVHVPHLFDSLFVFANIGRRLGIRDKGLGWIRGKLYQVETGTRSGTVAFMRRVVKLENHFISVERIDVGCRIV